MLARLEGLRQLWHRLKVNLGKTFQILRETYLVRQLRLFLRKKVK